MANLYIKYFLILHALSFSEPSYADILVMGTEKMVLQTNILETYPDKKINNLFKEYHAKRVFDVNSFNRSYTCFWSLKENRLMLDSISIEVENDKGATDDIKLSAKEISAYMSLYAENGKVIASWFSGTLNLAWGNRLFHTNTHRFIEGNVYTNHIFVTISKGIVVSEKYIKNCQLSQGMTSMEIANQIAAGFPWGNPLYKKCDKIEITVCKMHFKDGLLSRCKLLIHSSLQHKIRRKLHVDVLSRLKRLKYKTYLVNGKIIINEQFFFITLFG